MSTTYEWLDAFAQSAGTALLFRCFSSGRSFTRLADERRKVQRCGPLPLRED